MHIYNQGYYGLCGIKNKTMAEAVPQEWFEMVDLRRRRFATSVWIPLRVSETLEENGREEVFAAGCVAFPPSRRTEAETLGWSDLGLMHSGGPYAFRDRPYKSAEIYQYNEGDDMGIDLIFDQHIGNGHGSLWHINQDLILALELLQEGDVWVRPAEGYVEVIRQRRNKDGKIRAVEIRSDFLRDYLAARGLALRLAYYRQRVAVVRDASNISWATKGLHEESPHERFSAQVFEVDADGGPFGGGVAVFQVWRTDVDAEEDVPVFGPETNENTSGQTTQYTRRGEKHYRAEGELWREEWIEPADRSERVRQDPPVETISYIIDASGRREINTILDNEDIGRYLWFSPHVVKSILNYRGSGLRWYTGETGSIWLSPDWPTHFGLNRLGLINVYAYDIAKLPLWQQRVWSGYNASPDGAVSAELLSSQMQTRAASTKAPEFLLPEVLNDIDAAFESWLGTPLFQKHDSVPGIINSIHRFRAVEQDGILALSKDIARLIADRIMFETLRKAASPPKNEKWGSLKSLEKSLATIVAPDDARSMLTPLVGIYNLRLGDAHLPSNEIDLAFDMVGIDVEATTVEKGKQLLDSAVNALVKIRDTILKRNTANL